MNQQNSQPAIEEILRAGNFLGNDPRPLRQILDEDAQVLARHGVTPGALAARLQALRDIGLPGQGAAVTAAAGLLVRVEAERGTIACPFGDAPLISKVNVEAVHSASGRSLFFSDLSIHLIAAHGFLQGRGAPFRLEPEQVMDFLAVLQG